MVIELKTGQNDAGRRLDRILRKALPDHSLSLIHRLLRQGKVLVNGSPAGPDERIHSGMTIRIETEEIGLSKTRSFPEEKKERGSPSPALPEIIWRGSGVIVFNKPPGLAAHGPGGMDGIVRTFLAEKLPPSLSFRPGPLHRLDKPSSGLIAFSESLEGARLFTGLLKEKKLIKTYLAIVEGHLTGDEIWRDELIRDKNIRKTFTAGGRPNLPDMPCPGRKAQDALTSVTAIAFRGGYTLIQAKIETGRTHQIRSQAAAHGHPLAGDVKYSGRKLSGAGRGGFYLHSWKIETNEKERFPRLLIAPPPENFLSRVHILFGAENKRRINTAT